MNINGVYGLIGDSLTSIDSTAKIELSDNEINLEATNVLVNGSPITGVGGFVVNPMSIDLNANDYNILNAGLILATSFVKNGGTSQQYLMGDGSSLQYSANSGNSNFYLYNNGTDQYPTPQNGYITYNTAIQDDATIIYISHRTRDNIDIEVFFKNLSSLNDVYIQDQENSANSITYNITGTPTIVDQAQITIPVTRVSSFGTGITSFGNGHNILLSFFTNSIETDARLTTLESKTQNITAIPTRTTFTKNLQFLLAGSNTFQVLYDDGTNITPRFFVGEPRITSNVPMLMNGYKIYDLGTPTDNNDATTKLYVDNADAARLDVSGGTMFGTLSMFNNKITDLATPTNNNDAANKLYVDNATTFENVKSQRLNTLYYNPTTNLTSYSMNMDSWRYCSWGYSGLTVIVVDTPTASITHLGGSLASIGVNGTILPKGFKIRTGSNVSSNTNGAVSGWLGAVAQYFLSPRAGWHIKIGFTLDASTTTSFNRTMVGLFQSTARPTLDSTNTIASVTTGSMGIVQELGETVFSFNTRGTSGSTKIPSTIPCQTPNNNWYALEMINEPGSTTITLILTCQTDAGILTDSATFICGTTNTMPLNFSYIHLQQNMATAGATAGSAGVALGNVMMKLAQ